MRFNNFDASSCIVPNICSFFFETQSYIFLAALFFSCSLDVHFLEIDLSVTIMEA